MATASLSLSEHKRPQIRVNNAGATRREAMAALAHFYINSRLVLQGSDV